MSPRELNGVSRTRSQWPRQCSCPGSAATWRGRVSFMRVGEEVGDDLLIVVVEQVACGAKKSRRTQT